MHGMSLLHRLGKVFWMRVCDCDESLIWKCLNLNQDILVVLLPLFYSCGESCLLVSWGASDMCTMTVSDEDRGTSRKHIVEDRG
jgi:hypothetical protein